MNVERVGVVGAGTMGNGIAHVFARGGYRVILCDVEQRFLDRGLETIGKNLDREVAKNKISAADKASTLGRIEAVLERGKLAGCDFVVEAATEKFEIKTEIFRDLDRVCRPANLPAACPGWDHVVIASRGFKVAVFTVLGRQYMNMKAECPFLCADRMVERLKGQADAIVVEIHAEATSEKQALGWHLDGRVTAVLGTHTHVPTADARVLPKGTAFICDVGMTGPYESVLGREIKPVIGRFTDGMPRRFEVATGDVRLSSVLIEIDPSMARAAKIELLTVRR